MIFQSSAAIFGTFYFEKSSNMAKMQKSLVQHSINSFIHGTAGTRYPGFGYPFRHYLGFLPKKNMPHPNQLLWYPTYRDLLRVLLPFKVTHGEGNMKKKCQFLLMMHFHFKRETGYLPFPAFHEKVKSLPGQQETAFSWLNNCGFAWYTTQPETCAYLEKCNNFDVYLYFY